MTPTTIPDPRPPICHETMAVKWHSELSRCHAPPLTVGLLSLLPQQRGTFATALQEGCVLRLVASFCRRSSHGSPSFTTAPAMTPATTSTMKPQTTSTYQVVEDEQE